jgi:bifunctional non-homologous end joining protein LigD
MEAETNLCVFGERRYAMKKHHATRLHYDLRLEWNGVLLSWALREGPDCRAGVVREAVEMDDHRSAHLLFEGVHETGPIMLWDCGTWIPHPECSDIGKSLREGVLRFTLHGEKLKGDWVLAKTNITRNARSVWTLSKCPDAFAESYRNRCVLLERPNSIRTGRTLEEIARDWVRPKDKYKQQMKLFDAA